MDRHILMSRSSSIRHCDDITWVLLFSMIFICPTRREVASTMVDVSNPQTTYNRYLMRGKFRFLSFMLYQLHTCFFQVRAKSPSQNATPMDVTISQLYSIFQRTMLFIMTSEIGSIYT